MRCRFCGLRNKERQIAKNKLSLVWGSWQLGFREVGSLTTLILATDTDVIIQIPAVFVKTTKAKSRKKRENLYQDSA